MVNLSGATHRAVVDGASIRYVDLGQGSPVLLLHGFPQTHAAMLGVAGRLAAEHRVVAPDLPGYGGSHRLDGSVDAFDKRRIATHLVRFMHQLGEPRFAVVGHDRGALVAFRMAMSHPEAVSQLACLSVVPAGDQWAAMQGAAGLSAFHLHLLAQPPDLPERMLAADPELFFGHFLDSWVKVPGAIPEHARRSYVQACSRPETIHAICDDYRAGALIDAEVDVQDHRAGRRVELPVLAAWPDPGDLQLPFDPAQVWRSWAPNLTTAALDCGHFLPEEQPDQVAALVRCLITRS